MRVLLVAWDFPPHTAGAAVHVDGLTHALADLGHEVVVVTVGGSGAPSQPNDSVRVLRAAVDLPWIPDEFHVANAASASHHVVRLAAAFDGWVPDVVHAHNWELGWAAGTLAELFGVPWATTMHSTTRGQHGGHVPPGEPSTIHAVESWIAHSTHQLIATSKFMAREVANGFELPEDRIHRIPNGINPEWWAGGEHPSERSPLVVSWGRVRYEKGFQVLGRAIALARRTTPDLECIIAGRGSFLPELQSQLDVEGVSEFVRLVGFLPDERLRDLLHRAACVVIPSLYEPFGIVALEALAAGVPLIAARTGGLAELLDGTGAGMLFEPGNADELAACIELATTDHDLADSMRSNGAELLSARYSWEAIAKATVGVYRGDDPSVTDDLLTPRAG